MGDQLRADLDALESFATQLDVTRSQFDATSKNVSAAGAGLGNPKLASALADFDRCWHVGREVLDSYFGALSKMVSDSVKTLRERDTELAHPLKHRPMD